MKSLFALLFSAAIAAAQPDAAPRIVTIGGPVTEIVFALGAGGQVVAVDQSSLWPPEAMKLPQVGYIRAISPESVLAAKPTLVITTSDLGPPPAAARLEAVGVPLLKVPAPNSPESIEAAIAAVAARLGAMAAGEKLKIDFAAKIARTKNIAASLPKKPRVALFMQSGGGGRPGVLAGAGRGTKGDALIALAGGENVFASSSAYQEISPEALVAAVPDIIIVAAEPAQMDAAGKQMRAMPAVAATPAGKSGAILVVDLGAALNFGPRLGDSACAVAEYFQKVQGGGQAARAP